MMIHRRSAVIVKGLGNREWFIEIILRQCSLTKCDIINVNQNEDNKLYFGIYIHMYAEIEKLTHIALDTC